MTRKAKESPVFSIYCFDFNIIKCYIESMYFLFTELGLTQVHSACKLFDGFYVIESP